MRCGEMEVLRINLSNAASFYSRQRGPLISNPALYKSGLASFADEDQDTRNERHDGHQNVELSEVDAEDTAESDKEEIDGKREHAVAFGDGHGRWVLAFVPALQQQQDAANERNGSDDGWQRNGVLFFRRHLNGAEVNGLLRGGVGEALVSEGSNAENDEQDAEDGGCFHKMDCDLEDAAALDEAQEDEDDGDHEQDVNEAADGGAGHETEQPEDDEYDGDGSKHEMGVFPC